MNSTIKRRHSLLKPLRRTGMKFFLSLLMLTVLGLLAPGTSSAAESTVELITYYHSNIQGSPMAATDEDGNTLWTQSYSPYGYRDNSEAQTSRTDLNRIGFTGHVEDKFGDRQLIYMQARYYDPALGRFLSADPVGFHESNPVSFNRYAYANNNPLKYVDPDGRIAETVWDVANVGMGLASLGYNVSEGNYWSAALDGLGVVADGLASVIPFVPGGAAAGIKVSRYGGEVAQVTKKVYHYTDEVGAKAIEKTGVIKTDSRGRVFVTPDKVPASEANNALFMGRGGAKGTHRVEIELKGDVNLNRGTQPNELIHDGAIRDPRQGSFTVKKNDF